MKTLYTSDLHFGHTKILDFCPQRYDYLGLPPIGPSGVGATVEEMNEALVDLWNRQVGPDDAVVVGGDLAMGQLADSFEYVHRLNGRYKTLIMGNHDRCHPCRKLSPEKQARFVEMYEDAGFDLLMDAVWDFDGITANVCHFPYEGDSTAEERYPEYRPVDNGRPLVHGHIHDMWQTNGRQYNLGIDAWAGEFRTAQQIGDHFRSLGFTS